LDVELFIFAFHLAFPARPRYGTAFREAIDAFMAIYNPTALPFE
jgi:hypothetical protein